MLRSRGPCIPSLSLSVTSMLLWALVIHGEPCRQLVLIRLPGRAFPFPANCKKTIDLFVPMWNSEFNRFLKQLD